MLPFRFDYLARIAGIVHRRSGGVVGERAETREGVRIRITRKERDRARACRRFEGHAGADALRMMTRDLERHVAADAAAADHRFFARADRFDEMPYPFRVVAHFA